MDCEKNKFPNPISDSNSNATNLNIMDCEITCETLSNANISEISVIIEPMCVYDNNRSVKPSTEFNIAVQDLKNNPAVKGTIASDRSDTSTIELWKEMLSELKLIAKHTAELPEIASNVRTLCERRNTKLSSIDWSNISDLWRKAPNPTMLSDLNFELANVNHSTPKQVNKGELKFDRMFMDLSKHTLDLSNVSEPTLFSLPPSPCPMNQHFLTRPQGIFQNLARPQGRPNSLKAHTTIEIPSTPPPIKPPTSVFNPPLQTPLLSPPLPHKQAPAASNLPQRPFTGKISQRKWKQSTFPAPLAHICNPIPQTIFLNPNTTQLVTQTNPQLTHKPVQIPIAYPHLTCIL